MQKVIKFSNDGTIDPKKVKEAVYNRIDFELPEFIWEEIDFAFGDCWNNKIGLGLWVHDGEIEKYIHNHLTSKKILFEYDNVEAIVKIIYDYIEMTGGFMDD